MTPMALILSDIAFVQYRLTFDLSAAARLGAEHRLERLQKELEATCSKTS